MQTLFSKSERATFRYWFAHWCAYQMTALTLRVWKPKYLLHDLEKPFLKLFMPYKKVQKFHRTRASHHRKDGNRKLKPLSKIDLEAMILDWECSRLTKKSSPETAREYYEKKIEGKLDPSYTHAIEGVLIKFGL